MADLGTVKIVSIDSEMRGAYLDYAMSVIVQRALPDVRDGLKPVQRRILYAMHDEGLRPGTSYRKSAGAVGEVLKKYHPHGEAAVYDALVRMVQDFVLRYPLIDGQGNFGCFTGDTTIKLLDGTDRSFAELAQLPPDEIFYVYSVDHTGQIVVGEGRSSRITRRRARVIELTFDDGSAVRCTPDHRFMLRDGSWKQAQHLTIDDSLMAGYFDTARINERTNDYLRVLQLTTGAYEFVHCLADAYNARRGLARPFNGPFVRHHKNFNRFDNRPTNIERLGWLEHLHLHAEQIAALWQQPEFRDAQREGVQRYYATNPDVGELRRQRMIAQNQNLAFRQENGTRVGRALRQRHAQDPELMRRHSEHMRQLWQDPDYRASMGRVLQGIKKRPLTLEQKERVARIIARKSREMWQDPAMRQGITAAIIAALSDPGVRSRLSENSRRLWRDPRYRALYAPDHHRRMAQRLWSDPAIRERHRAKIAGQWENPNFRAAQAEGVKASNARRLAQNPRMMAEMATRSAASLRDKWADPAYKRRVMRTRIAGYAARLMAEIGREHLTPDVYDQRRDAQWVPTCRTALAYFDSFDELLSVAATHNHRVVAMRWLDEPTDVYDITVDEFHNFMLSNGCVVHNSMDGDSAAAMRYTESRLAHIAEELLADIDKDTVDFRPNYDDREREPSVLPARLPNLLLNGVSGIAVGMATNIPPHNLSELCDGVTYLIDHPDATVEELAEIITGPDFPTGGLILGREGILQAYATGKGRVVLRAKAYTEEARGNRYQIVVTEIPYMVNKASLLEKIAALVKEGKVDGISDLRDESDRSGVRVVIELKRDAQPIKVLNNLYKHSQLQVAFGVNMLALVDGKQPRVLTLKMVLHHYIEHRQQVLTRRTQYELTKARQRAHILEGLRVALDHIDAIIATIRNSRTTESARNNLMTTYKLTEVQATAILDLQLRRLAALERKKIDDEYAELLREIKRLEGILGDPRLIQALIKADMVALKEKYGDERRTRIIPDATGELTDDDLIPDVGTLVTITERGYIKRLPPETYRAQGRGGRGVNGMSTREADTVQHILGCNTMDSLLFFTNRGRVFVLRAHELPDASRTAKGMPIINFISIQPDERVTTLLAVPDFDAAKYLVMCTRQGTIKRTVLSAYSAVRSNGLIAITLDAGDELLWVRLTTGRDQIIISTRDGKAIRFAEDDVRAMGRTAAGVMAIRLAAGDQVAAMDVVDLKKDLLVVSEFGHGKRTPLTDYPLQGRAGSGVITMKLTDKTGKIVSARVVESDAHLMLISAKGTVIRIDLAKVPQLGRGTQGVRLQRLAEGDRVASVEPIDPTEAAVDELPATNGAVTTAG